MSTITTDPRSGFRGAVGHGPLRGQPADLPALRRRRRRATGFFEDGVPGHGLDVSECARRRGRLNQALGRVPLLQDHAEQELRDVVARVTVPSLVICGAYDAGDLGGGCGTLQRLCDRGPVTFVESSVEREIAGRDSRPCPCEHPSALILDDCGHAATIDQPALVLAGLA